MIEFILWDLIHNRKFNLMIEDLEKARKFYIKLKYSKKLKLIGINGDASDLTHITGYPYSN